jgi:hypothetical protein
MLICLGWPSQCHKQMHHTTMHEFACQLFSLQHWTSSNHPPSHRLDFWTSAQLKLSGANGLTPMGLANLTNLVQSNHVSFRWQSIANTFPVPGIQILYRTAEILPACPKSKSIKISITSYHTKTRYKTCTLGSRLFKIALLSLISFNYQHFCKENS